jgi:hypothetical protein
MEIGKTYSMKPGNPFHDIRATVLDLKEGWVLFHRTYWRDGKCEHEEGHTSSYKAEEFKTIFQKEVEGE